MTTWEITFKNYFALVPGMDSHTVRYEFDSDNEKEVKKLAVQKMDDEFGNDSPSYGIIKIKKVK